jgi:hypothetical protein
MSFLHDKDYVRPRQVVATNPAAPVRGPKVHGQERQDAGIVPEGSRELPDNTSTVGGLRDRALIATIIYTFGHIGAVIKMCVEDYYTQARRRRIRLHEKDGKRHKMPCNHNLEAYLNVHINAAGVASDLKGYLFRQYLRTDRSAHHQSACPGRRVSDDSPAGDYGWDKDPDC